MNSTVNASTIIASIWAQNDSCAMRFEGVIKRFSVSTDYNRVLKEWYVVNACTIPSVCICSQRATSAYIVANNIAGVTLIVCHPCIHKFTVVTAKRECSKCHRYNICAQRPACIVLCKPCNTGRSRKCCVCKRQRVPPGYPSWKNKCPSCCDKPVYKHKE